MTTRLLAVIDSLEIGGAQRLLLTLARALRSHGITTDVATGGSGAMLESFQAEGIAVHTLTPRSISHRLDPVFIHRLRLLAPGFDLVHAHLHASAVSTVASGISRPLVITHHSRGSWQSPAWRRLTDQASRAANAVITTGLQLSRDIPVRAAVIPPAVEPTRLIDRRTARAHLGVPPDAYVAGFIGRLVPDKNPLAVLDVARATTAHILIAGDGPLEKDLRAEIGRHRLADRVTLAGPLRDPALAHAATDVLLLPSWEDTAPLAVLEAMWCGNPVIASAVGDVPVQVGDTGVLIEPGDTAGLVVGVLSLADSSRRTTLGRAARCRVERFSVAEMAARTAEIYHRVLEERYAGRNR